jgi:molybdopterin converting factor small subunit
VTATIRLPRVLTETAGGRPRHEVAGSTVGEVLESLFAEEPGLRNHLLDEKGRIRPHVLMFVDADRADIETPVGADSEVQVLQAVSGG